MNVDRRQFMRAAARSVAGIGVSTTLPFGLLGAMPTVAQSDYRAIVCVLLAGGADSFNMLVPRSDGAYNTYRERRGALALDQSALLPLDGEHAGHQFGLHPALQNLQQRFNLGQAAWINNVGPLVEPTTRESLDAGTATLPLGLFSHSDQILSWQTATPASRSGTGFGGRLLEAIPGMGGGFSLAGHLSLSGNNAFQLGASTGPYALSSDNGIRTIRGLEESNEFREAFLRLLDQAEAPVLQRVYADKLRSAIDAGEIFGAALADAPPLDVDFADDGFSSAMRRIAELISVRETFGVSRQTFFVTYGGWDHHEDLLGQQAAMLPSLDQGLGQFMAAMESLGVSQQVSVFTISDFGRTLTSNGRGSDHGWGGNAIMLGGAVNGGQLYGQFPELDADNPLDVGRGRFLPTTASDAMFAQVARWMGVPESSLATVLPNWQALAGSDQGAGLDHLLF